MDWHARREAARGRHAAKYDAEEAERYDRQPGLGLLGPEDGDAYLADLAGVFRFEPGMEVLDVGAGTGALSRVLLRVPGLAVTALEPSPAMLAVLRGKPDLADVVAIAGSCDRIEDRDLFPDGRFDVVVSRQVVSGLFDPLTAFAIWRRWLVPGGAVVVIDGLFGRAGWVGHWQEEVDVLPLAACETTALTPYLLEASGFRVEAVEPMAAVNALPTTRTARYVVVARKAG